MFENIYHGKRVLITGHTGFKGSWLATWLIKLGAEVAGFADDLPSSPSNFEVANLAARVEDVRGDVRNRDQLHKIIANFKPEIVFHLAAQALVRKSYADPALTFETNAFGTMNLLECLRELGYPKGSVKAAVFITSDKCYRNQEWIWGYRESDLLGGDDPYSASKGCAELICKSYFASYFKQEGNVLMSTARAGNVIGGGDWATDRIVPDCVRAWSEGRPVVIRAPNATRPWQHVLEPLSGYLHLGAELLRGNKAVAWDSFNFGPSADVNQSVLELLEALAAFWQSAEVQVDSDGCGSQKEQTLLKLCCDKALHYLKWQAVLNFTETVKFTSEWYTKFYEGKNSDMFAFTSEQIDAYVALAEEKRITWA